jgi:hypothetical protein
VDGGCVAGLCDDGWYDCDFDERNGCESQAPNCITNLCAGLGDGGLHFCQLLSVSGDGGLVAFSSFDNGLVPDDTNDSQDLFLLDTSTRRLQWLTRTGDAGELPSFFNIAAISADGTQVVFETYGGLFDPDAGLHVYRLDRTTEQLLVLGLPDADAGLDVLGWALTLSFDGRFMATNASCSSSVAGDCLLRIDWQTGEIVVKPLASPLESSLGFTLSGNGRTLGYFEFHDSRYQPILFDVEHGTERLVLDVNDAGLLFPSSADSIALDFDGSHVAFYAQDVPFEIRVFGPSGILRYEDGGTSTFSGAGPTLSADGRVLGLRRFDDQGFAGCGAIDVATGQLLPLSVSSTTSCQPLLTANGRSLAATTGEGLLLINVDRP